MLEFFVTRQIRVAAARPKALPMANGHAIASWRLPLPPSYMNFSSRIGVIVRPLHGSGGLEDWTLSAYAQCYPLRSA